MSIWVVVKGQIVLVYQNVISIIWVMEKGINSKEKMCELVFIAYGI